MLRWVRDQTMTRVFGPVYQLPRSKTDSGALPDEDIGFTDKVDFELPESKCRFLMLSNESVALKLPSHSTSVLPE